MEEDGRTIMNDMMANTRNKRGRPSKEMVYPVSGTEFTAKTLAELNPLLSKATIVKKVKESVEAGRISRSGLSGNCGRKSVIYKLA